jgi:SAM-dependent methyltransferase
MKKEKRPREKGPFMPSISETGEPPPERPTKRRKANPQDAMQESNTFSAAGPSAPKKTITVRPKTRLQQPILLIKHNTTLDDSSSGGAIKQLAYLICRLDPINKLFTIFGTGCVLDNMAGHGILTRELILKNKNELTWPVFHTVDEHLDPMLVPQAALHSHQATTLGAFPHNCARMRPDNLAYPNDKFDVVVTIAAPDHFNRPAAKQNVSEVLRVLKPDGVAIFGQLWCLSYCRRNPDDSVAVYNKPRPGDTHKNLLRRIGMHPHQLMHQLVKAVGPTNIQLVAMQERSVFFRAREAKDLHAMLWKQLAPLRQRFTEEEAGILSDAISGMIKEQGVGDPGGWKGVGLPMPVSIVIVTRPKKMEAGVEQHNGTQIPKGTLLSRH